MPIVSSPLAPNQVALVELLENQFGNYVVQHVFKYSDIDSKLKLYEKVELAAREGFVERGHTYAKHVFNLINQTLF